MLIVSIVMIVVSIIMIVKFFSLCKDVSVIRNRLGGDEDYPYAASIEGTIVAKGVNVDYSGVLEDGFMNIWIEGKFFKVKLFKSYANCLIQDASGNYAIPLANLDEAVKTLYERN